MRIKRHIRWWPSLISLAAVPLLSMGDGCTMTCPNFRAYYHGNVSALGSLLPTGEGRFYSLTIGSPASPLAQNATFTVCLSDKTVLRPADFSRDRIERLATSRTTPPAKDGWGEGAVDFSFEGISFIFANSICLCFRANWVRLPSATYAPQIGTADGKRFYRMPLSQAQVEEIFGKPDRVEDKIVL